MQICHLFLLISSLSYTRRMRAVHWNYLHAAVWVTPLHATLQDMPLPNAVDLTWGVTGRFSEGTIPILGNSRVYVMTLNLLGFIYEYWIVWINCEPFSEMILFTFQHAWAYLASYARLMLFALYSDLHLAHLRASKLRQNWRRRAKCCGCKVAGCPLNQRIIFPHRQCDIFYHNLSAKYSRG